MSTPAVTPQAPQQSPDLQQAGQLVSSALAAPQPQPAPLGNNQGVFRTLIGTLLQGIQAGVQGQPNQVGRGAQASQQGIQQAQQQKAQQQQQMTAQQMDQLKIAQAKIDLQHSYHMLINSADSVQDQGYKASSQMNAELIKAGVAEPIFSGDDRQAMFSKYSELQKAGNGDTYLPPMATAGGTTDHPTWTIVKMVPKGLGEDVSVDLPGDEDAGIPATHVTIPKGTQMKDALPLLTSQVKAALQERSLANPKIKTQVVDQMIGGKPHNVLINGETGAMVKDLGEKGDRSPDKEIAGAKKAHQQRLKDGIDDNDDELKPEDIPNTWPVKKDGTPIPKSLWAQEGVPGVQERNQADTANVYLSQLPRIHALENSLAKDGKFNLPENAWSNFLSGKVGAGSDPRFTELNTLLGFSATGAMKTHFGSRGGATMYPVFKNYFQPVKDKATFDAALKGATEYMQGYSDNGKTYTKADYERDHAQTAPPPMFATNKATGDRKVSTDGGKSWKLLPKPPTNSPVPAQQNQGSQ